VTNNPEKIGRVSQASSAAGCRLMTQESHGVGGFERQSEGTSARKEVQIGHCVGANVLNEASVKEARAEGSSIPILRDDIVTVPDPPQGRMVQGGRMWLVRVDIPSHTRISAGRKRKELKTRSKAALERSALKRVTGVADANTVLPTTSDQGHALKGTEES